LIKSRGIKYSIRLKTENTSYSQNLQVPASPYDPESLNIPFLVIPAYPGIKNILWMAKQSFIELE
jgi:hypothetical protein